MQEKDKKKAADAKHVQIQETLQIEALNREGFRSLDSLDLDTTLIANISGPAFQARNKKDVL